MFALSRRQIVKAQRTFALALLSACLAAALPAAGQGVIATVNVGAQPRTPALNPVTGKVYVPNSGAGTVSVIDGDTNTVATVTVMTTPVAVAINPETNKIYVANSGSGSVSVIDGATNTVSHITVGTTPNYIAINVRTNRIYVVNTGSNSLSVIDCGTGTVIATVTTGLVPRAVAVNAVTNKIYVANGGGSFMTIVDGNDHTTTTVTTGFFSGAVVVNPVTNRIYVASYVNDAVTVVDGATNISTILAPGGPAKSIAVNPVTNRAYVALGASNAVVIIDGNNAMTTIAVDNPVSLTIDTTVNRLFAANDTGNSVSIINGITNTVTPLAVGNGPVGIAANPVSRRIYAVNQPANTVSVIDGRMVNPVTYPFPSGTGSMAINEVTNKIYANYGSVVELDGVTRANRFSVGNSTPLGIAVNSRTNKIYVAEQNENGDGVRVIDGVTFNSKLIAPPGFSGASAVAVNPVTNMIYATFAATNNVMVVDGSTDTYANTFPAGTFPWKIDIDTTINAIYVANMQSNNVSMFGSSGLIRNYGGCVSPQSIAWDPGTRNVLVACTDTVNNGQVMLITSDGQAYLTPNVRNPTQIAVNPDTNRFYVVNSGTQNKITVIDSRSGGVITSVPIGAGVTGVGVDRISNRVFVGTNSTFLAMVDGVTFAVTNLPGLGSPKAIAQNTVTGRVYIAGQGSNTMTEINGPAHVFHVPVASLPGINFTGLSNPVVTVNVANPYAPGDPLVSKLWYRLGNSGSYTAASGAGPFQVALSGLAPGAYKLSMFATDDLQGSSIATGSLANGGSTSVVGSPVVFDFNVVTPTTTVSSIVSRKTHPGVANCDVPIDKNVAAIEGAVSVEPRSGGSGHSLVFTFNEPVTIPGSASVTDAAGAPIGNVDAATVNGNTMTVRVSGIPDGQRARVRLSSVNAMIDANAYLGFLYGDVGGTRLISAADIAAVKARQGKPLTLVNCAADFDLTGGVDAADLAVARSRSATVLP